MPKEETRLAVRKMYKLYINGAFVRSESGHSDPLWDGEEFGSNVARASRKDARDAVVAARSAQGKWAALAPGTRGLILYRLSEMLEARQEEFVARLREGSKLSEADARNEMTASIDRTVWYAGWCDKFAALLSTRNPVGGPHFNFSSAEPMGVVALLAPDEPALLGLISTILPPVVAGNAVVALASEKDPRIAMTFAEALATCDLPGGVINILTGHRSEVAPHLARHMDVNALAFADNDAAFTVEMQRFAAENVKRTRLWHKQGRKEWFEPTAQSLDDIASYCEIKTIWHPAGI
ncbi:MAG: aldehyde dehydrogenase family protein [Candidatus Baltobacteraceae bacterium]